MAKKEKQTHLEKYQQEFESGNSDLFITIDPGARENGGTGIAWFRYSTKELLRSKKIISNKSIYEDRVAFICSRIYLILNDCWDRYHHNNTNFSIFIEKPKFFDTTIGYAAAKSESLFKLIYLYGRLFQLAIMTRGNFNANVHSLEITHWKGQLSKAQTRKRIEHCRPDIDLSSKSGDEIDAIGMGLYILGDFK